MTVFLSIVEDTGEAIISDELIGPALYGNALPPRASDGRLVWDRAIETKEQAKKYVSRVFPNLKIIDKTSQ
ncbi:MAG: hypothetical protein ACE5HI_15530 [bacterium]